MPRGKKKRSARKPCVLVEVLLDRVQGRMPVIVEVRTASAERSPALASYAKALGATGILLDDVRERITAGLAPPGSGTGTNSGLTARWNATRDGTGLVGRWDVPQESLDRPGPTG
jgi:hypothetical protein